MDLSTLSKYLDVVRKGHPHRFSYNLLNKCCGLTNSKPTADEMKELAMSYRELNQDHYQACSAICSLAEEVNRLKAENEFMLRLINSKLPQDI